MPAAINPQQPYLIRLTLGAGANASDLTQAFIRMAGQLEVPVTGGHPLLLPLAEARAIWSRSDLGPVVHQLGVAMLDRIATAASRAGLADAPISLDAIEAAAGIQAALPRAAWQLDDLPLGEIAKADPAVFVLLPELRWIGCDGSSLELPAAVLIAGLILDASKTWLLGEEPIMQAAERSVSVAIFDGPSQDRVGWIACDIDDMTGEEIAHACDHLRQAPGVIDLVLFAGQGKKGRPVTRFELLCRPDAVAAVCDEVFLQTTTLGVRYGLQDRAVLPRWPSENAGRRAKVARRPDGNLTAKTEADDIAALPTLAQRRAAAKSD